MKKIQIINDVNYKRLIIPFELPNKKSGIYFLWNKSILLYIGKATNIRNRLFHHYRLDWFNQPQINWNEITAVSFFFCKKEKLDYFETSLIRKFKPVLNYDLK